MRNDSNIEGGRSKSALEKDIISTDNSGYSKGYIAVVGTGPGHAKEITPRAMECIRSAEVIVGYHTYMNLIADLITDKEQVGTGMKQEIDRCRKAVELAVEGKRVVVISSGDPGVYGMAGLVLELIGQLPENEKPECEIIGGLSAVTSAAAILGAPLMHDFVVLSLSDLLTPWELIKKRARLAGEGDFVIALYNPRSRGRITQLDEVREILLAVRDPKTPVGIVRKVGRLGMNYTISDLENFTKEEVDMQSTVIIGNSNTYVENNRMITPRGYKL